MEISGSKRKVQRIASDEDFGSPSLPTGPGRHIQRDQGSRRARGLIACAECSRMKLRCDKNVPCESCLRRGCSNICPNGVLSGRVGKRLVLANTENLHGKLRELCERIRQLEDALAILQAACSRDTHPLLSEELLGIKRGIDVSTTASPDPTPDGDFLDAFGTLTISDRGASRFIGRSGGTESLIMVSSDTSTDTKDNEIDSSSPSYKTGVGLPQVSSLYLNKARIDNMIAVGAKLPSWGRASSLCETYLEHSTWLGRPVQRSQLIDELLVPIYAWKQALDTAALSEKDTVARTTNIDDLALLLMVFAVGAFNDLTLPPFNEESGQYYKMMRSITSLEAILASPSLASVQMLCLVSLYHSHSQQEGFGERSWGIMRVACVIGINIGLHRDPARWKLEDKIIQRRREVFWQIFTVENMQSLVSSGRPTINMLRYTDCEYPENDGQSLKKERKFEADFWKWRFRLAKEVLYTLNDLACSVRPVRYSDVLAVDKKIHGFIVPPELRIPPEGADVEKDGILLSMHRCVTLICRDLALLHLHRSFFCKALLDCPANPLRSPFAPSFLSGYRTALSLLKLSRDVFDMSPELMSRSWVLLKHVFTCLVIVGSVATRGPHSDLALPALAELAQGIELFETAARHTETERVKQALVVLRNLRDMARHAYAKHRSGQRPPGAGSTSPDGKQERGWEDELAIFGGLTRFVATKDSSKAAKSTSTPSLLPPTLPAHSGTGSGQASINVPVQQSLASQGDPIWQYLEQYVSASSCIDAQTTLPFVPAEDLDPTAVNWAEYPGFPYPRPPEQGGSSVPEVLQTPGLHGGTYARMPNDPSAGVFDLPNPVSGSGYPADQAWGSERMPFPSLGHLSGMPGSGSSSEGEPNCEDWAALLHELGIPDPGMAANQI